MGELHCRTEKVLSTLEKKQGMIVANLNLKAMGNLKKEFDRPLPKLLPVNCSRLDDADHAPLLFVKSSKSILKNSRIRFVGVSRFTRTFP